MTKKQKGFTLVELMIVVAIIGVLAAVAIPKFADMLEKSREGATKGNLSSIKSAVSNYYADNQGTYPQTLDTRTFIISGESYPAFINKYIEVVPAVKVTSKNTANTGGAGQGPGSGSVLVTSAVHAGTFDTPAFTAPTAASGKGWKYNNSLGYVWVNSAHLDMAGKSYTLFGFE